MSNLKSCPIYIFWNVVVPQIRNNTITKAEQFATFKLAIAAANKIVGVNYNGKLRALLNFGYGKYFTQFKDIDL